MTSFVTRDQREKPALLQRIVLWLLAPAIDRLASKIDARAAERDARITRAVTNAIGASR